ncbi:MAG: xanthine dehydrogenase molybdopterin binding subunit [Polyangiales bacterium]
MPHDTTPPTTDALTFTLNGETRVVRDLSPTTTLLEYLRGHGLTGSKEGCAEGDCGACTVLIVDVDAHEKPTFRAVNACITFMGSIAGRDVVTVEGVGSREHPHPVQAAMVEGCGSQCGFCTPGFIAAMVEGYYRDDIDDGASASACAKRRVALAEQLSGNLCRCTGYRPIRDAMLHARSVRSARDPEGDRLLARIGRDAKTKLDPLDYSANGARFQRPTTIDELCRLHAADPSAVLVAGATELGVERNKKPKAFPKLISTEGVAELRRVTRQGEELVIGGAATLTQLEEAIAPALDSRGERDRLHGLRKMIGVFAARAIRNRATVAGNLVTASPIGDLAPVLLSLDAEIVLRSIRGERRVPLAEFFVAYRKTVLAADEIVSAIVVPLASVSDGSVRASSFKVSKRRELDIAIVAAGMVVDFDRDGRVRMARLGFGGVAATPVRAKETETLLVGRLLDAETIALAEATIAREFKPIDDVRGGAEARRGWIASLLRKFLLGVESEPQDGALDFVPLDDELVDDEPSRSLRHESAWGHVTGGAVYVDDQASRRGDMLELWPVMSAHAHATITSLDVAAARAMPGVVDVLTAAEIPGLNDIGAIRRDEPLLASGGVRFAGQMIAVVVAKTITEARSAAAKVVVEYAPKPAVLGIAAAIEANSFHTNPHVIARGEVEHALNESPHRLAGAIELGGQEHFYLESQAAWAERGDDGDVFVVSSTQHPSEIQAVVSHALHLPRNKVVVQSPRMGGGFGGKETQGNAFAALVALAAFRTGKPARIQLDRDVDMLTTGKRHPFFARYDVGFGDDGEVLALDVKIFSDGGYALDLSESILDRALFHLDNAYYLPAVRFEGRVCKTNVVSHTAFRGFGGPQGMLVVEEVLDRIARARSLAPEIVRERNLYRAASRETNTTHYGQHLDDNRIERIWRELAESAEITARRESLAIFNASSEWTKRGLAMTPVKFGISFTASFLNQAGALVVVYRDGTVQVNHGGTEMGQGLHAKMIGVTARELGVRVDTVRAMKTQTDKVPNTSATAASSGADLNGAAVKAACATLRERLRSVAVAMLSDRLPEKPWVESIVFADGFVSSTIEPTVKVTFAELVERAHLSQVSLSATGFYRTPNLGYDKATGTGRPFHYFAYGAAVSEVEIDGLTGMKRLRRVDILHDVGESMNPRIDRGQVEGAFVQGVGWLTGEELKWSKNGALLTHSASTYQIPSIGDAPYDLRVKLLSRAKQAGVIHGSKAVGEPPLMLAISAREAIRDAIAAFGARGGDVSLPSPATHEAIFMAVRARLARA